MYFRKYLYSFFAILLVYCTCYCKSELYETYENTIMGFSSYDMGSAFLKNGDYRMLSLHNDSDWSANEKECKCVNGRCENVCAEWKNGACRKTKQACVCYPDFAHFDEQSCRPCDCGKGISCTIDRKRIGNKKECLCPEGYYEYIGECAPFCSASQPCLNGGACKDGKCHCMGHTHGPFCERITFCATKCRPRLIVDCVYIQKEDTYGCLCKNRSLLFDYQEWVCKPCPCGEGLCTYDNDRNLKCNCKPGYKEFQTQCRKCDCGSKHACEILENGEKSCKCREGFFAREGTCLPCECGHKKAACSLDNVGRKKCICPEGFEDILGLCERKKVNCTCHLPTATCNETVGGFDCVCKDGYARKVQTEPNPEEPCIDINECYDARRCPRSENQKCVNFPGSYMCQCETGYQPVSGTADNHKITCIKYKPSWLPTGITVAIIIAFIGILVGFAVFLKKRESSRLTSAMEMRQSR